MRPSTRTIARRNYSYFIQATLLLVDLISSACEYSERSVLAALYSDAHRYVKNFGWKLHRQA